jgi:TM2 domain-containing membrane protein YozV
MDCVNHGGVNATAYCQNCGKGLCADCINAGAMRKMPGGQILCDRCIATWQSLQPPFAALHPQGPNPSAAAVLGLIPGVGAMYNGQFFKGLVHVIVFVVLVSITSAYNGIFGIFIGAWVLYQSFEAFHTARAMRDGLPLPDPLGLNEVGNWLNLGAKPRYPGQPGAASGPISGPAADPAAAHNPAASAPAGYQPPYAGPPYAPPAAGFVDSTGQPLPPLPPFDWRRKEPVGAIVLIGLGVLFLLDRLDIFSGRLVEFAWPLALIGLGVWLIVRRLRDSQGGPK